MVTMSVMRMKLKFEAMQILLEELQQNEMWAIYLMGLGEAMTEKVTKANLTNIIKVLQEFEMDRRTPR